MAKKRASVYKKILVVEDDPNLSSLIHLALEQEKEFKPKIEPNPLKVIESAEKGLLDYDLILMDIGLPGMSGKEVLKRLKSHPEVSKIPVLMITGSNELEDEMECLEAGADDFIRKPFAQAILLARIKSVLKRIYAPGSAPDSIVRGLVTLDFAKRLLQVNGVVIPLTSTEFNFIKFLAERGKAVDTRTLLRRVWGFRVAKENLVSTRRIQTHVDHIRAKLRPHEALLATVPRFGYRFNWEYAEGINKA